MKKKLLYSLLLPVMTLFGACSQEEIVFDHEKPAFEIKEGQILLEVIAPKETADDDVLYISGEFNGGDEAAAADIRWQLEKSTTVTDKWGIYLDPSSFMNGKTLADGYHFVSKTDGEERGAQNAKVWRTTDYATGTRNNIYVNKWASFYDTETPEPGDTKRLYVEDNSGWEALALYAYGDAEVFGAWPGAVPAGEVTIGKTTLKYFDLTDDMIGKKVNLIFNNNNNGSQFDALSDFVVAADTYLSITDSSCEKIERPSDYTGWTVYIQDLTSWGVTNAYGWFGDGPVTAAWPGIAVTGEKTIKGYTFKYIEMGTDLTGKEMNLILNNNAGDQCGDFNMKLDRDFYLRANDDKSVEEIDIESLEENNGE